MRSTAGPPPIASAPPAAPNGNGGTASLPAQEIPPALPDARAHGARALVGVFGSAVSCWFKAGIGEMASAIAFQTQLSLAPFLLLLLSGASRLLGTSAAREALLEAVGSFAGPAAVPSARAVIDTVSTAPGGPVATAVGIVTMAYFSSAVILQLRSAMNRIWGTRSSLKGALYERLMSLVLVPGAVIAIILTMAFGFASGIAAGFITHWFPNAGPLWNALSVLLSFGLLVLQLGFVFRYGANVRLRWRDVWPGAALTAALFTMGNALIGLAVGRSLLIPLYGPAGALVAVLLWVYYGAQILLFGACFTRSWAERFGSRSSALIVH